jgi:hypothetical protein
MIQGGPPSCSESAQSLSFSDSDDTFSVPSVICKSESLPKSVDETQTQQHSPSPINLLEAKLDLPEVLDLCAGRGLYDNTAKETKIRISLPMANEIVSRLQKRFKWTIREYLLASPHHATTPADTAIFAGKDAADFIVQGMEDTLETRLYSWAQPGRSVGRTVGELETRLMVRMKSDCASWIAKWVLGNDATKLLVQPLELEKAEKLAEENRGVRVLVKRAEECVRDLVGMMIWVSERTKC